MKLTILTFIAIILMFSSVDAETLENRMKNLEDTLKSQEQTIKEQQRVIEELKEEIQQPQTSFQPTDEKEIMQEQQPIVRDYRLDDRAKAIELELGDPITPYQLTEKRTASLLNPSISLIVDTLYYESSLSEKELEEREIPGYRPLHADHDHGHSHGSIEKGFNLRSAELTIFAPVDPYFNLYTTIPFTEDDVEIEEAYFVTTSLPAGLQVKGGKFKSGFGRFNAFHPHAWNFVDAPLPYLAFLGDHGLMEKGVQVTYLPGLPFYTLLGFEVLQGENEILYGEDAKSGPHAYAGFAKVSLDIDDNSTLLFGGSITGGDAKNESVEHETEFTGDSMLYGLELTYKWKPSKHKSFVLQSEYLYRDQDGDLKHLEEATHEDPGHEDHDHEDSHHGSVEPFERQQDGIYVQGLYQIGRWRIGARYDVLDIFTDDFELDGESVDFGDNPYRLTASLEFNPTEFSRLRLQYNYDKSSRDEENNEVFLQLILGVGAHGAHSF